MNQRKIQTTASSHDFLLIPRCERQSTWWAGRGHFWLDFQLGVEGRRVESGCGDGPRDDGAWAAKTERVATNHEVTIRIPLRGPNNQMQE